MTRNTFIIITLLYGSELNETQNVQLPLLLAFNLFEILLTIASINTHTHTCRHIRILQLTYTVPFILFSKAGLWLLVQFGLQVSNVFLFLLHCVFAHCFSLHECIYEASLKLIKYKKKQKSFISFLLQVYGLESSKRNPLTTTNDLNMQICDH